MFVNVKEIVSNFETRGQPRRLTQLSNPAQSTARSALKSSSIRSSSSERLGVPPSSSSPRCHPCSAPSSPTLRRGLSLPPLDVRCPPSTLCSSHPHLQLLPLGEDAGGTWGDGGKGNLFLGTSGGAGHGTRGSSIASEPPAASRRPMNSTRHRERNVCAPQWPPCPCWCRSTSAHKSSCASPSLCVWPGETTQPHDSAPRAHLEEDLSGSSGTLSGAPASNPGESAGHVSCCQLSLAPPASPSTVNSAHFHSSSAEARKGPTCTWPPQDSPVSARAQIPVAALRGNKAGVTEQVRSLRSDCTHDDATGGCVSSLRGSGYGVTMPTSTMTPVVQLGLVGIAQEDTPLSSSSTVSPAGGNGELKALWPEAAQCCMASGSAVKVGVSKPTVTVCSRSSDKALTSLLLFFHSASGGSMIAIDNKIEQAMVRCVCACACVHMQHIPQLHSREHGGPTAFRLLGCAVTPSHRGQCVSGCPPAGPGEDPPDDGRAGGGGGAERADQGAEREERPAGEGEPHPACAAGARMRALT
ncbi:TSC22 domain family protein 4 isoform X1 [Scleropages formosus]|uniref:TSC22 domain family protein 4 isoform X1 n=1 Tax=Scleropages formosus TaxID=113540 RepID=UPI0008781C7B|nr:TSC22 domain family protein 4 isoform X1 [Scleropages formosus]